MSVTIRSAQPGDGKIIWTLAREFAEDHGELGHFKATTEEFEMALFGENSVCGCEIGSVDGEPAGQAFWHRSFSSYLGKPCIYIEDIYVREKYRRKGIGRLLIQRLAQTALREDFAVIYWLMTDTNLAAQAFYESVGAEFETGMYFYRLQGDALLELAVK